MIYPYYLCLESLLSLFIKYVAITKDNSDTHVTCNLNHTNIDPIYRLFGDAFKSSISNPSCPPLANVLSMSNYVMDERMARITDSLCK